MAAALAKEEEKSEGDGAAPGLSDVVDGRSKSRDDDPLSR